MVCLPAVNPSATIEPPQDRDTASVPLDHAAAAVREHGFAIVSGASTVATLKIDASAEALRRSWDRLPADPHLADGGKYRFRRHASFIQTLTPDQLKEVPYRPHWQPRAFNKLHGGTLRPFSPIEAATTASPLFRALVTCFGRVFADAAPGTGRWFIEAHQFRIDASQGEGRPTPEGAHRDGVDYVALVLLERAEISGGATTIHLDDGSKLAAVTLATPWTAMLLDDQRVIHATTPIKPTGERPHRDSLVLTYRCDGFLEPAVE